MAGSPAVPSEPTPPAPPATQEIPVCPAAPPPREGSPEAATSPIIAPFPPALSPSAQTFFVPRPPLGFDAAPPLPASGRAAFDGSVSPSTPRPAVTTTRVSASSWESPTKTPILDSPAVTPSAAVMSTSSSATRCPTPTILSANLGFTPFHATVAPLGDHVVPVHENPPKIETGCLISTLSV